jgi:DNA-nicking Smr family endonuclease
MPVRIDRPIVLLQIGLGWVVADQERENDRDEFEGAMADVVRLPSDPRGHVERAARTPVVRQADDRVAAAGEVPDDYAANGVDRRELRKLRGGHYTVRARLDLHGMTAVEATKTVRQFLDHSRHVRHHCVCIVHGRGLNSPHGVPVLKTVVRNELMRSASVLAFTSAPRSEGGAGAVCVLLRR